MPNQETEAREDTINPDELFGHEERKDKWSTEYVINWPKVRGAFLKYIKEVDEWSTSDRSPSADTFYQRWLQWMQKKTGGNMAIWVSSNTDRDEVVEKIREFYKENEEFRNLVNEKHKWKEEDDTEAEETDEGDVVEEGDNGESDRAISPGNIGDWSNIVGETDSVRSDSVKSDRVGEVPLSWHKDHDRDNYDVPKDDIEDLRNNILLGNVYEVLDRIPDNSVDSIVTSPPYWNLRDYEGADGAWIGGDTSCDHNLVGDTCSKCGAWYGQLGNEDTVEQYVDNMMAIITKMKRVLKPGGSFFLNIGDTYAGEDQNDVIGAKRKSMLMVPHRVYLAMIKDGWVLRNEIVWAKQIMDKNDEVEGATNPASVKDRLNYTHEPFWWFTNDPDYYHDIYSIRREHKTDAPSEEEIKEKYDGKYGSEKIDDEEINSPTARMARDGYTPSLYHDAGALPPDVWRLPTGSSPFEHTAVFSEELVKRPIRATVPDMVCPVCLAPYERKVEDGQSVGREKTCRHRTDDEPKNGIVLEPFIGRGTTAKVALDEGVDYIGVEISEEYLDIAEDFVPDTKKMGLDRFT